ncbi:MAG: hypothetical protein K5872_09050 [Rhizobiaceae bacterium]|nr:hypothetical protein [Rhizobiaceae bacterium]MCV0406362.1 hypothetical protein [Rhizobiaceae bacterium]
MRKTIIVGASALFATSAFAQMAPVEPSPKLDASTDAQVELQEPMEDADIPLDLGITNALQGEGADIKDSPKYDANTKNSGNLEGR